VDDKRSFAYLIRLSKIQDQDGDLNGAIASMETAMEIARTSKKSGLYHWALANLGDMYGHDGQVEKSYRTYLKVLSLDPGYYHALSGIAWIAYSHDRNLQAAESIAEYLLEVKQHPDPYLLLAEIAAYRNDTDREEQYIRQFVNSAEKEINGNMYHAHLARIHAEHFEDFTESTGYVVQELDNRPTPQSYDLLAWNYYCRGQTDKALEVARTKVEGATYEPDALYHLGVIYQAAGQTDMARRYLEEAREARFELGPVTARDIDRLLQKPL
ncbi:MAG: hypothetical protein R3350_03170, partial [Saprospiraceae bacterium]|nr:hypothetical protein [Saprospiraceae bacterium]